jgi:hypothetical protein
VRAVITAYQYNGGHRNYDPRLGRMVTGYEHWDYRYRIVTAGGLTVYYRQGFCTYDRAVRSLCRNWPKVVIALKNEDADGQG